ncbi:MAG: hypothetical protein J6Z01_16560, partial [Bacteroidales bacterium]|nr:hypothetical protein [Bacteroidales bacterium]
YIYRIVEEDHHFEREGDTYYRVSKIYRITFRRRYFKQKSKELIWDNHSEVMFNPSEIPAGMIR